MKIADSTVSMASTRYYKSVTELTTATVDRFHHEGGTDTYVTAAHSRATHIEASGQASVFSQAGNLEQVEEGKPKKTLSLANRDPERRPAAAPAQDWLSPRPQGSNAAKDDGAAGARYRPPVSQRL